MKMFWGAIGSISLVLGVIGIVLPLLPTVPFLILSAFCFARSSQRMHNWLMTHRTFGPMIVDWRQNGAIRPKAKRAATVSVAAVFSISLVLGVPLLGLAVQAVALSLVMLFIWTRPDH